MSEININGTSEFGQINISNEVIAIIVGTAIGEVEGVLSPTDNNKGTLQFVNKKVNFAKGVRISVFDNIVECEVDVVLKLGTKIVDVSNKVQQKIITTIETMTGLKVGSVNVNVINLS
ncbi:MAG: Asp23/Gls24 family envelope stress response protein [Lachnospirales bacterium]